MQWHTIAVLIPIHFLTFYYVILTFFKQILTLPEQAAQLAYIIEDRLKDAAEKADKEKALKDIVEATTKEKVTTVKNAEARARGVESD